ncbi:MAG: 2TM domain-containing protein, partial [Polyangiaceae bacterium]
MAEPPPTYTREEMDAILKRAIERQQAKSEEIGHEDLVAAAGEVGIPREEVEAAARDLEAEKARRETGGTPPRSAPQEMNPADEDRARAVRRLYQRAMTFFGLSMFFVFIGHETGTDWWMWAVFGMGISLVIQAS